MNNKPVAWMNAHTGHLCSGGFLMTKMQDYIPLYTHPSKDLTDEEIKDALYVADITLDNLSDGDISMERIKAFVRTVLRKAQENEILEKKTT